MSEGLRHSPLSFAHDFARRRQEAAGSTKRPQHIVTLERSFHGRTCETLAATAQPGKQEAFSSLLFDDYFTKAVESAQDAWREVVAKAALAGIPVPAFSSSLSYYDGLRSKRLPAALIQGQRDFFGAHTYGRVDQPGAFHTLWSGDRSEIQTA